MDTSNLFNGRIIADDLTLIPSDGSGAGSSSIISGIAGRTDFVVTVVNPGNVPVQMLWSENKKPYAWDTLGASATNSQQTPMRLRPGMVYRLQASGAGAAAYIAQAPDVIEFTENSPQGLL